MIVQKCQWCHSPTIATLLNSDAVFQRANNSAVDGARGMEGDGGVPVSIISNFIALTQQVGRGRQGAGVVAATRPASSASTGKKKELLPAFPSLYWQGQQEPVVM